MSWSILLLPLLGGYYYLTKSIRWLHYYKRTERQRLIFDSLLVGFVFFSFGYIIWRSFEIIDPIKLSYSKSLIGIDIPFFYPSFLSLLLSIAFTKAFNYINSDDANWYLSKVILRTGNSLQKDFLESYFSDRLAMITLKNGKVYVGVVAELHEAHPESSFVKLVLVYSGYRDINMDVKLIKDYNLSIPDNKDVDNESVVTVVIAESEILSMTFYDQDVYDRLNEIDQTNLINN